MTYTPHFQSIVNEMDQLIKQFSHHQKDIGYGYRRTLDNGHWIDLIDYTKTGSTILRVGRWARLVETYPVLRGMFDEILGVIAKLEIQSTQTLYDKHIIWLLEILNQAPKRKNNY